MLHFRFFPGFLTTEQKLLGCWAIISLITMQDPPGELIEMIYFGHNEYIKWMAKEKNINMYRRVFFSISLQSAQEQNSSFIQGH